MMQQATPVLAVTDLSAGYGGIDVLQGVSLSVGRGEVLALLGPNGAGKSTLLKAIAGILTPSTGAIQVMGRDITRSAPHQRAKAGICLIPEGRGVFTDLTVTENLKVQTYLGTDLKTIIETTFDRFPRLAERKDQRAGTMSGGEQQMLALARAIATDPALILLDELSMGLAPAIVAELYELVSSIAAEGRSILVVEQFAQVILDVADVSAVMVHGEIVASGDPYDIESQLESIYLGSAEQRKGEST